LILIANEIAFLISFSISLSLVHRNTIEFYTFYEVAEHIY
jgi:hypothetical protein